MNELEINEETIVNCFAQNKWNILENSNKIHMLEICNVFVNKSKLLITSLVHLDYLIKKYMLVFSERAFIFSFSNLQKIEHGFELTCFMY